VPCQQPSSPEIVQIFKNCATIQWAPVLHPSIQGYQVEFRDLSDRPQNWLPVNPFPVQNCKMTSEYWEFISKSNFGWKSTIFEHFQLEICVQDTNMIFAWSPETSLGSRHLLNRVNRFTLAQNLVFKFLKWNIRKNLKNLMKKFSKSITRINFPILQ